MDNKDIYGDGHGFRNTWKQGNGRMVMTDENTLGDQPIESKYTEQMNVFAAALDDLFNEGAKGKNRKVGFCLMIFPFDGFDGRANYISNASRSDVIKLLKEQIKRFEEQDKEGN